MIQTKDDAIPCEHIIEHDEYQFPLSNYQKYAISAIEAEEHVIVSAPTGTGKTLIAEHAIRNALKRGKKAIYTSPLVALTNQKFSNFKKQYPEMNLGVLTGFDSENSEGNVLLMTTEILLNKIRHDLFSSEERVNARFAMDLNEELAIVIFDEVHYFSDEQRGRVWEEIIMLLPPHVVMVMLSGTLASPTLFADWILKNQTTNTKNITIVSTPTRIVPLKHYAYYCITNGQIKNLKGERKEKFKSLENDVGVLLPLHGSAKNVNSPELNLTTYTKLKELEQLFIKVHIKFTLNHIVEYALELDLLPAIGFVLSRSKVEEYAHMIETCLYPVDSMLKNTIENHAMDIVRSKLVNYREVFRLDQFQNLMTLFKKGIGIHHAGMLPVLRELVEILVEEGMIQLLFCTETFAAGLNMPIRCVMMISLEKYNGRTFRYLLPDEYSQMGGRGGRRGKDSVGYVIHLNNNFALPIIHEYKTIN
jgi:antiviral helicase SKI2